MCTTIVTIRTVLWYVVSLTGTLLILLSLFTNQWLHGNPGVKGTLVSGFNQITDGDVPRFSSSTGLFLRCKKPSKPNFFEGECIPDMKHLNTLFTDPDDRNYPHAWRGAVICFVIGFGLLLLTDVLALLTIFWRRCMCCSIFTFCGSVQSLCAILFTIGLLAFPVGWGSDVINEEFCQGQSAPFMLGPKCTIGFGFYLALVGTIVVYVASSLAIWAYQSTRTARCEQRIHNGDRCICLP